MATDAAATRPSSPPHVLDFARAFRAAARAVGFYPSTHQHVLTALDQLMAATRAATAEGVLCLTVLPHGLLAGGAPLDETEAAFAGLAAICHRHCIGALILDRRATPESWRALFTLVARKPEEVRAAGGVQRQWKALRHVSPAILEIDFGELLRGHVGGDFAELAGVISHYLETAGVGGSILDNPCGALQRAAEHAENEEQAVAALLKELRVAAQLTWSKPDQFEDVFRRASAIGESLNVSLMTALLERRGTPEAMVGALDVVTALVERMPDSTVSKFLAKVMGEGGTAPPRLRALFASLVPDEHRRRIIVHEARDVALDARAIEQWDALVPELESQADRRFVSDQYLDEIHAAQIRVKRPDRAGTEPPERRQAWVESIADEAIKELDLMLLADLARIEDDPTRSRRVLDLLQSSVLEAANEGDWPAVARATEVITGMAASAADKTRRESARGVLDGFAASRVAESAVEKLAGADPALRAVLVRVLSAIGPALIPAIVALWAGEGDQELREGLEQVVVGCGRPGREVLRRLLSSNRDSTETRVAAAHLLELTPGTDHLPILEATLSDGHEDVRNVAFDALANSSLDRALDILARGIGQADAAAQAALLDRLFTLGDDRMLPVLRRVFRYVDPQSADVKIYLTIIAALGRAGSADIVPLLDEAAGRTSWGKPVRAWRIRSALKATSRALSRRGPAAAGRPAPAGERTR